VPTLKFTLVKIILKINLQFSVLFYFMINIVVKLSRMDRFTKLSKIKNS